MSKTFDPYHKWLGIRPEEQPANYYRLLGIALFEDDADAIAGAADQRMAHVRSFQTGNYAALSQRILNEIAVARVCLLTPQKKAAYDQALKARFIPPSPPPAQTTELPVDNIPDLGYSQTYKQHKKSTPSWMPWAFVGIGGLVVMIIFTVIAKSGRDEQAVAKTPTTTMPQPISPKSELKRVEPKVEAKPQRKDKEKVDAEPEAKPESVKPTDSDPLPEVEAPKVDEPAESEPKGERKSAVSDIIKIVIWNQHVWRFNNRGTKVCNVFLLQNGKEVWRLKDVEIPWTANQDTFISLPVPHIAADTVRVEIVQWHSLGGGLAEIEVFCDKENIARGCQVAASAEYSGDFAANTLTDGITTSVEDKKGYWLLPDGSGGWAEIHLPKPKINEDTVGTVKLPIPDDAAQEKVMATIRDIYKDDYKDKTALAKKLIQKANETQNAADRFVLLQEARDLASETWQGQVAFEAIDAMASEYDISSPEMKATVIELAAKKPRITAEQKTAIANAALQVVDEAIGEDKFDAAKKAGRIANQLVRQTKDKDLLQEVVAKGKQVGAAAKAYADAQEAITTLKDKPDDPDANTTVGKYLCFTKGNWAKGLPMLAKGNDAELKALAERDIADATSTGEQVKLGDAWWGVSTEQASYWYEQALPGLTGLEKDRVAKRVAVAESNATGISKVYLADLSPRMFHIYPDIVTANRTPQEAAHLVSVKDKKLAHGLWAPPFDNSFSQISYQLPPGGYRLLTGIAGVARSIECPGLQGPFTAATPLTFRIMGDGKLLWRSQPMQKSDDVQPFRVRVHGVSILELFVDCPGSQHLAVAVWIDPVLTKATSETDTMEKRVNEKTGSITIPAKTYLADLTPASAVFLSSVGIVRWENSKVVAPPNGPTPLEAALRDSHGAQITGNRILHGLWGHPPAENTSSRLSYNLGKQYRQLNGAAGISDNDDTRANFHTPLIFRIVGDGRLLWRSQPMQKAGQIEHFEVVVAKTVRLELFVDCMGNHHTCQAVWIDPVLTKTTSDKVGVEKKGSRLVARDGATRVNRHNVAIASNGTIVDGTFEKAKNHYLLDGNTTDYGHDSGAAGGVVPCEGIIQFPKTYQIQEIRFLLWDKDSRYFQYRIEISRDGQHFVPFVDHSKGEWRSWQDFKFSPQPIKAIKLIGLRCSANEYFSVVEFEAYTGGVK